MQKGQAFRPVLSAVDVGVKEKDMVIGIVVVNGQQSFAPALFTAAVRYNI